jgi:hypothetical protein
MIKYVGPNSSCIFILNIYYLYIYKLKDILKKTLMWVLHFYYSVIKMGKYSTSLLKSSVVNISACNRNLFK